MCENLRVIAEEKCLGGILADLSVLSVSDEDDGADSYKGHQYKDCEDHAPDWHCVLLTLLTADLLQTPGFAEPKFVRGPFLS